MKFGLGQALTRKEDDPLIRGAGRYVADVAVAESGHAVVLRSPHARARFRIVDTARAKNSLGVRAILTGEDVKALKPMPCVVGVPGQKMIVPPYYVLARSEVHHVGDAVAFVVADTLDQARDAAEAIEIEWQEMSHVIGAEAALAPGAPQVWPDRPGNLAFEVKFGDREQNEAAFARAAHVVELKLVNQRLVTNYMEARGVVAQYDGACDHYTLTLGSQGSHAIRDIIGVTVLGLAPDQMRVVTPDVGGGFGTKLFAYREYALAAFAAKLTGKPVTWIADRTEHFLGDTQGRDNITTARLALDSDGKFLALDIDLIADMGAYLSTYAPYIPYIGAGMLPGVYDFPSCYIHVRAAHTNTVPVDAYRGAGRPEASYVTERLVDQAAREIGIAPEELRRRNFIRSDQMPYKTPTGKTYDSGEFDGQMSRALKLADHAGFPARAEAVREHGRLRGIGIATYIEACGGNGPDTATLSLDRDGMVHLHVGTQTTGQGHDTAFSQIVAQHLSLPPERIRMLQGDTARIATGTGTGGSSSIPAGGNSVAMAAAKLADQLKNVASHALEADPRDLEFADGSIRVAGTDRAITLADLAAHPKASADALRAADAFVPKASTYPNGTHVVEIEIDEATGHVAIVNYVIVDDFGFSLNPLLLEGQVHGGTVQGIGQALLENTVYDEGSGQLLTASLMDYALPRAEDAPLFVFETRNVPCLSNPLGVKGAGEAGAIGSCPAIMNAVIDALWRGYKISHMDMPATPERVWVAIDSARGRTQD
jgi:carbon-monoxide dehydrogenase large subunit